MNEKTHKAWLASIRKWLFPVSIVAAFIISIYMSTDSKKPDETELILWGIGAGQSQWDHGWAKLNRIFLERHPGVKIVTPPDINVTAKSQKLMSAIVGNAAPDLVGGIGNDSFFAEWAARGAFMQLDAYLERDKDHPGALNIDDWVAGAQELVRYKGKIYGIPTVTVSTALFYNVDALISAGFTDTQGNVEMPKTAEEYLKFCKRFSIRDEAGNIKRLGSLMGYHHMMRTYRMGLLFGGKFFSDDGKKVTFTDPHIVKALEYMTEHSDYFGGPGKFQIFNQGSWKDGTGGGDKAIFNGQLATLMHGQFYLTNIVYNAPDLNYGISALPFPSGVEPVNLVMGFGCGIPKGAKHPDLAWEYIKWIMSEEGQLIAAQENFRVTKSRGIPFTPFTTGNRKIDRVLYEQIVKDNPDFKPQTRKSYKIFLNNLENSINCDPVSSPVGGQVMRELDRAHDLAVFHVKTPYEALKEAGDKIQADLDWLYSTEKLPSVNWNQIFVFFFGFAGVFVLFLAWRIKKLSLSRMQMKDLGAGIVCISPWIIGFLVFMLGPIVFSIVMSFTKYNGLSDAQWIGMKNYADLLLKDPIFWKSFANTAFMFIGIPINMAIGLGIAMLLNMKVRGVNVYRTIYYLPSIIPFVASTILWVWILHPTNGILNLLLSYIGIQGPAWLGDANWTKPSLILMGIWTAGGGMIIWLAGLKGIPQQLYETARVDGANWWHQFRYITIPMLTPYIFFNLIMGIIGTLQIFVQAVIMGAGSANQAGPLDSLLFYVFYLFNNAFVDFRMGYASAMAWILFFMILILTLIQLKLAPRWVHYEGKTK
ncbi:extracellular solute-binding protein [candidate division KSB1 bacterium]|nr:extracellular solute-binding protein [candidate division KSB1 bacterium]